MLGHEGPLPQVRRALPRRAGARRGRAGRGQADQRAGRGPPDGRDHLRPRGGGALLRAAVRQREGCGQLRRDGRRRCRCAATCRWSTGTASDGAFLLDVRQPVELVVERVPGAVNIPLPQLRARLGELPRDREIHVICRSAQRAYYATRILLQNGFKARNISGGTLSRAMLSGTPATVKRDTGVVRTQQGASTMAATASADDEHHGPCHG